MGKRGAKAQPIDWDLVGKLAHLQCTQEEIAFACKVSVRLLDMRAPRELKEKFSEYVKKYAQGGRMSLRRWQWKAAEAEQSGRGSKTMLIWLGKQYLGQSDQGPIGANPGIHSADPEQVDQLATWLEELDQV